MITPEPFPHESLDWQFKGFPAVEPAPTAATIAELGWDLYADGFMTPLMVLRQSAIDRNITVFKQFADTHGVDLAPHAKTTMAPKLVAAQADAGVWAITVANVFQARAMYKCGARRLVIANQVCDPPAIRWVAEQLAADPTLHVWCWVDSLEGVRLLADGLRRAGAHGRLGVICELGIGGGRTGCRNVAELLAVADAAHRDAALNVAGVGGYEGPVGSGRAPESLAAIGAWVADLAAAGTELIERGLLDTDECLVTAGGSAYFDVVTDGFAGAGDSFRVVLRSGAYVGHDSSHYEQLSPLAAELESAMELHGTIQSTPEPGLAIADFGRRDAPFDAGMPVPFAVRSGGASRSVRATVRKMDDQHAYVDLEETETLEVGDRILCGISHPCTAFDRWKALPVIDDDDQVVAVARTLF